VNILNGEGAEGRRRWSSVSHTFFSTFPLHILSSLLYVKAELKELILFIDSLMLSEANIRDG
jgi:hypothetical protein